jgi:hypothetical protein
MGVETAGLGLSLFDGKIAEWTSLRNVTAG